VKCPLRERWDKLGGVKETEQQIPAAETERMMKIQEVF
jgi:hypothetical protein